MLKNSQQMIGLLQSQLFWVCLSSYQLTKITEHRTPVLRSQEKQIGLTAEKVYGVCI